MTTGRRDEWTTIVLVRHAATAWSGRRYAGRGDPPLTAAGRRSAQVLAGRLAATFPTARRIVTSPSRRAYETAAIVAARMAPIVLETDERWLEADFGDFEGRTFDEIDARDPDIAARLAAGDVDLDWPGGEAAAALFHRVSEAWAALLTDKRPTIVVSHAGPIRIALALAISRRPAEVALPAPAEAVSLEIGRARRTDPARHAGP
jgi:ribonuclease H / adenosylcobalamin/alpha-ribazole phosphatase